MGEDFMNKEFWICPVRGITEEEQKLLKDRLDIWECHGMRIHYPPRDTNQDDPIGYNICTENKNAIKNAGVVRIYYNPTSTGSMFDLGMTFMAQKPLFIINPASLEKPSTTLEHLIYNFALRGTDYSNRISVSPIYHMMNMRSVEIQESKVIEYEFKDLNWEFLFDFGMAFMADKPIILKNREEVDKQRTPHKSFQNVLLHLDDMYRRAVS